MRRYVIILFSALSLNAQNKPSYPEPKDGFKKVDFILPKINDSENYKVEIRFSFEADINECSNADFSFNPKNLKEEYGIPYNERFPFYVLESADVEIMEGTKSDCNSSKKVTRKIFSTQNLFIEYEGYYARPFYIPKSWSLEYRIWKAGDKYKTVEK